ncbi:ABC transporter permease [candidate division KSB1 bacterium]|nr:MAG: ABC transporter permease [candidate division KSB1 bacterium]
MNQIKHIIKKELLQVFRDKPRMVIIFLMPLIQLFILGYAITTDIKNIPLVICDMDNSSTTREIIDKFKYSQHFSLKKIDNNYKNIKYYLYSGKAALVIVIPVNFTRNLIRNENPQIQLIVDGQDANSGNVGMGYAINIINFFSSSILIKKLNINPEKSKLVHFIKEETRIWYNPDLLSINYVIPGIVAVMLTMITTLLTGLGIVREKEIGTIEQIIVSPIKPYQFILGKTIPFVILGFIAFFFALGAGKFWFKIPFEGNILILAVFCLIYLLITLGIGIFVSSISYTQQQALFIIWFFSIFTILMSGFLFPIENMPEFLQYFTYLVPLRYFMFIIRSIFLKGSEFQYLIKDGIILILYGISIFGFSSIILRKKIM